MTVHTFFAISIIGICSALLHRIAKRPEEPIEVQKDWRTLPDDIYLNDALLKRLGGKA